MGFEQVTVKNSKIVLINSKEELSGSYLMIEVPVKQKSCHIGVRFTQILSVMHVGFYQILLICDPDFFTYPDRKEDRLHRLTVFQKVEIRLVILKKYIFHLPSIFEI